MNNWIILLTVVILIYLGICLFFYWKQEAFLFHPRHTAANFQYDFSYPYQELFFNTPNNGRIHALKFTAEETKGLVFYLHGNAGSLRDWGWVYMDFVPRGYDLVVLDYRTYGKSTGKLSENNLIQDAMFVFDKVSKDYAVDKRIIYGRSIGTGIATQLAAMRQAKALILETPYYSIKDVVRQLAPFFPLDLLLRYQLPSYAYINDVTYPKYIIHGDADQVVPYRSGLKLFEADTTGLNAFIPVPNGQHNDLANHSEFSEMLDKVLK